MNTGRFLFVLPPFAGHVIPAAAVGRELSRRGHAVGWATYSPVEGLLPEVGTRYLLTTAVTTAEALQMREASGGRWMAGFKAFWSDVMLPLNREMLPQVDRAIGEFRPDVVVADQQAIAGALAARRAGLRWATSAATFAWASATRTMPAVQAWVDDQLAQLQVEAGLEPVEHPDLSSDLILAYTTRALAGATGSCLPFEFVGAPVDGRADATDFPWDLLDARPKVFVSLGTVSHYRGREFLHTVVDALEGEPFQVIVAAPPELLPECPPNFILRAWVPQLAVLGRVDVVICNAGFSTTGEVLAQGLPVVLAPIAYDSSIVAERVVAAGAGVRVRFYRCTARELRDAVREVHGDRRYRQAAVMLQEASQSAGGARAAADALEARFVNA